MIGPDFASTLDAARAGDERAYAVLWRDANPALLRYLRSLAPRSAEDVAAETWVQVVRGLPSFTGDEGAWRGWLFTVARRRAMDDARHRARHPTRPIDDHPGEVVPDAADLAIESIGTDAAVALVATLPRQQAEVILLRVVAGLDYEQVAAVLGRSAGSVRVAAHRGLRRLADTLGGPGVTP